MSHACHAVGCRIAIDPQMLMCRDHWFQVPVDLRRAVWRHYARGQEDNPSLVSAAYAQAARRAVVAVAQAEGRKNLVEAPEVRLYDQWLE